MSIARILHGAWRLTAAPAARRFQRALADPERAQQRRLRALLAACAPSAYGRSVQLERVSSVRQFQDQIPVVEYQDLAPWIARLAAGEPGVLTREPVRMLERTSGSTAQGKLIPYTAGLLAELHAATTPWMHDLLVNRPALRGTRMYFAVSPPARPPERTPGGLRVGFDDDSQYFGTLERAALRRLSAVPLDLARSASVDAWRHATLVHLLGAGDLGALSVWSPSFLGVLVDALRTRLPELLAETDLPAGRARAIRRALDAHGLTASALWPRLRLVSCWTDGPSARLVPALQEFFPSPAVEIQGKGLLATEGVVSLPLLAAPAPVLAVNSHFLELIDLEHPEARPLLAHEARPGATYTPLLTTGAGLVRYRLNDAVQCVGRHRATPLVRFVGKLDGVSDLCGEKLHPEVAGRALAAAEAAAGARFGFALIAPNAAAARYDAYVEAALEPAAWARAAACLERELARGPQYAHARRLGQLAPACVVPVTGAWAVYERTLVAAGTRVGEVKARALDARPLWPSAFAGAHAGAPVAGARDGGVEVAT